MCLRDWVPYCGHLAEVTFHCNGPLVRSSSCPLASEIPKGESNLALSEVRKQLLGGFSSRPPCFMAHREKNANFVIKF